MTGLIQKENQQIRGLDNTNIQPISKCMKNNLLIGGLQKLMMKMVVTQCKSFFMTL